MTDLPRSDGSVPDHERLYSQEVHVSYDNPHTTPIILEVPQSIIVSEDTPYGRHHYRQLHLAAGVTLTPAEQSPHARIAEFAGSLRPYSRLGTGALLRTIEYYQDMNFLDIIAMDSSPEERAAARRDIERVEQMRMPSVLIEQRELFDTDMGQNYWIRFEATYDPDERLRGKIIMARLAYFDTHKKYAGVVPKIYGIGDDHYFDTPEQLAVHKRWLYIEQSGYTEVEEN